jgi:hypothetical protein
MFCSGAHFVIDARNAIELRAETRSDLQCRARYCRVLTETGNPQDVYFQIPCKSAHRLSTRGKEEDAAKHTGPFLGAFRKIAKSNHYLRHVRLCPHWNNSIPTGRILLKFDF